MSGTKFDMVTILGPTASGKTEAAVNLAFKLDGEIISADSRQVYREMNLGTGKDIEEYRITGGDIPYHLIDIAEAGSQYNVFEFQRDFLDVYHRIQEKGTIPIMCGGSGMYLEAILKGYRLIQVPVNECRRAELQQSSLKDLTELLMKYKTLNNKSDTENKKRTIRAIEIEEFCSVHPEMDLSFPVINSLIVGIKYERDSRRQRITERLRQRIDDGMIEEVKRLLDKGLKAEDLIYYGLEYKYITLYIIGKLKYDEMFTGLNTAIHQFAKRQMTWFRKMEREGFQINWLDGNMPANEKTDKILFWFNQ